MANKNSGGAFLTGMLVGSVIGTVVGMLIAPRSGKETRSILKKSADALPEIVEDLSTTMKIHGDRLSESTQQNWQETLMRLREAIAAGLEASQLETQALEKPREMSVDTPASENHL